MNVGAKRSNSAPRLAVSTSNGHILSFSLRVDLNVGFSDTLYCLYIYLSCFVTGRVNIISIGQSLVLSRTLLTHSSSFMSFFLNIHRVLYQSRSLTQAEGSKVSDATVRLPPLHLIRLYISVHYGSGGSFRCSNPLGCVSGVVNYKSGLVMTKVRLGFIASANTLILPALKIL